MSGVLDGVRVLEWGTFHAGPGGGALLGDLGAEVIKIEEPGRGDPERAWMRLGDFSLELPGGSNALFEASNRNKKSLTLNLQQERGREVLCRLVGKSDVFLTNFRAAAGSWPARGSRGRPPPRSMPGWQTRPRPSWPAIRWSWPSWPGSAMALARRSKPPSWPAAWPWCI